MVAQILKIAAVLGGVIGATAGHKVIQIMWMDYQKTATELSRSTATIRSAALPSHFSGTLPATGGADKARLPASRMACLPVPIRRLVPSLQVTGRSVVLRRVRQGIPSAVVSSWIPPLSVRTCLLYTS